MAKSTLPLEAQAKIRSDILAGNLRPGSRLKFAELQRNLGASVGVIREALVALEAQGLIESEPQVGFRVVSLSAEDLQVLTDARIEIECLVFSRAIREGDLAWEASVVAHHHRLERTPAVTSSEPDTWAVVHRAFHESLLQGCSNTRLRNVALGMRDAAALYQIWSQTLPGGEERDVAAEHRRLMEAVVNRDETDGARALGEHIAKTSEMLQLELGILDGSAHS